MRHATVYAIEALLGKGNKWNNAWGVLACSWEEGPVYADPLGEIEAGVDDGMFSEEIAGNLLRGQRVVLPTCPACAALLDLALEMRGS